MPRLEFAPNPIKEAEPMSPDYGAFIQIIQKQGNNISYISYPLPRDISHEMTDKMMTGILNPEDPYAQPTSFANGDLKVLAQPGLNMDVLDRLISVPRNVLTSDHPDHESQSMVKYYNTLPSLFEEAPTIQNNHFESLFADTPRAKVADGGHIYQGAYEYQDGEVLGWDMGKTRKFNLLELPKDEAHKEQVGEIVRQCRENVDVTMVIVDQGPTVADCAASCARFFELKEAEAAQISHSLPSLEPYQRLVVGPALFGNVERKIEKCDVCGGNKKEYKCICKGKKDKKEEKKAA